MRRWWVIVLLSCGAGSTAEDAGDRCVAAPGTTFTPRLSVLLDGGAPAELSLTSDPLEFVVSGLPPCAEVQLTFTLDGGHTSQATFVASADGLVTTAQAPRGGTWAGADLTGPFWSMSGGTPLTPQSNDLVLRAQWPGGTASTAVQRTVLPVGTVATEFREPGLTGLYGTFYRPPGPGPFPVVVVFGGSEGGLGGGQFTGRSLVKAGFAVLAIAYWGVQDKPQGMSRIPLEILQRAARRARLLPGVKSGKVALLGVSRGGEASLLAGASFPDEVQAVVALMPSGYAWAAPGSATTSTWTLDGGDVPFIAWPTGADTVVVRDAGYSVEFSAPFFTQGLEVAAASGVLDQAAISVERTAGPVLLWASGDDGIWPSCRLAEAAWDRLVDAGHATAFGDQFVCVPGAGHGVNPGRVGLPVFDLIDVGLGSPRTGFGGSASVDSAADREVLNAIVDFLQRALR
jgi:dienelactone hydrolase